MRKVTLELLVLAGLGSFSQTPPRTLADVTVVVFDKGFQEIDACDRVTKFEPYQGSSAPQDLAANFNGCTARGIPPGRYIVRVATRMLNPYRDYGCSVTARRSVCLVMADSGGDFFADRLDVEVSGLSRPERVWLLFKNVFGGSQPWSQEVGLDRNMRTSVETEWLDLIVTVVVDGIVAGSATIDRRISRHAFTISVDLEQKRVMATPVITSDANTPKAEKQR